jgi:hypothetical protein
VCCYGWYDDVCGFDFLMFSCPCKYPIVPPNWPPPYLSQGRGDRDRKKMCRSCFLFSKILENKNSCHYLETAALFYRACPRRTQYHQRNRTQIKLDTADSTNKPEVKAKRVLLENMSTMPGKRLSTVNTESDREQMKEETSSSGLPIIFPWTNGERNNRFPLCGDFIF